MISTSQCQWLRSAASGDIRVALVVSIKMVDHSLLGENGSVYGAVDVDQRLDIYGV